MLRGFSSRSHIAVLGDGSCTAACRLTSTASNISSSSTSSETTRPPLRQRLTGTVMHWHPFDRRGTVVEATTGRTYTIANARAFETVLPTLLRSLNGATVTFLPAEDAQSDRVIIRSRTDPIHQHSYDRKPPIDFYNPFGKNASEATLPLAEKVGGRGGSKGARTGEPVDGTKQLFAKEVVVDLASIPSDALARLSGPLGGEDAVKPTTNLKDMRSSRIFDRQTNEYLQLRRALGSGEAAQKELDRRAAEAQRNAVRREVVATGVVGVVVAWSAIHRSGVVLEGITEIDPATVVDTTGLKNLSIIRNVFSFESAMPTSHNLLHHRVTFTKVTYSTQGDKTFAEDIHVEGNLAYDASAASAEEARQRKVQEKRQEKRERTLGVHTARQIETEEATRILRGEDGPARTGTRTSTSAAGGAEATAFSSAATSSANASAASVPEGPVYGVITRWSGGQGTVESGDGRLHYIQSAADFVQLVDRETHTLRGAVVTFTVQPDSPRYARELSVLSTATTSVAEMKPLLDRVPGFSTRAGRNGADTDKGECVADAVVVEVNDVTGKRVPRSAELEPEDVDWVEGTLLSWSPHEDQGIISGADGERYVLRDAAENVIQYESRKPLFKKGRKVRFTAFGSSGRLACNVVALATEADEAELREEELRPKEPRYSIDGNMDEAIAAPSSTAYWMGRMTKVGFDISEVKRMQDRAITMDEFDDDNDDPNGKKLLDSEEIMKADEWWRDPRKNKRLPNSDVTAGHLALMGPASMLNTALKASNPKSLNKMVDKYQSRLSEEHKEMAWQKAKEMAPKYEEQVRKARERNEEPTFYFF